MLKTHVSEFACLRGPRGELNIQWGLILCSVYHMEGSDQASNSVNGSLHGIQPPLQRQGGDWAHPAFIVVAHRYARDSRSTLIDRGVGTSDALTLG